MIWNKLIDRCLLFTDAPGQLLRELLKEAEIDLANKLEIYDSVYTMTVPTTLQGFGIDSHDTPQADNNYTRLPHNFLKDISVTHNGFKLRKLEEDEIYRKTNGQISSGTPTAYGISGDYIVFDTEPSSGDVFILYYKASISDITTDKVLTIHQYIDSGTDQIVLGTTLGALLNGKTVRAEDSAAYTISNGTTTSYTVGTPTPGRLQYSSNKASNVSKYDLSSPLAPTSGIANLTGALATVIDYRDIAPVIPDRFHIDLCNYAVAIANAKTSPETYNQYWTKWMMNMDNLVNEAADRDLIFSVREEI